MQFIIYAHIADFYQMVHNNVLRNPWKIIGCRKMFIKSLIADHLIIHVDN